MEGNDSKNTSDILLGVGTLVNAGANVFNAVQQGNTQRKQLELYQQQFDWAKHVQQQTWQREDTALQRMVEDAQAAGLSPLSGLSGHASGSTVSAPSMPNLVTPQVDGASLQNGLQATANLAYMYDKLKSDESLTKASQDIQRTQLAQQLQMHNDTLSQDMAKLLTSHNHEKEMLNLEKVVQNNATILTAHKGNVKVFYDKEKYQSAVEQWAEGYESIVNEFQSVSQSNNTSGGVSVLGTGANLSDGDSASVNSAPNLQAAIEGYISVNPFPVLCGPDGAWRTESEFYKFAFKSAKLQYDSKTKTEEAFNNVPIKVEEATNSVPGKQFSYSFSDRY